MTLLTILGWISVGVIPFIIIMRFIDWLRNHPAWISDHPAHTICKELPPRTEPCKHERFVMDWQIRVIECKQCGMRAWVEKDHVDLFAPDLTAKWIRDKIQGGNQ